MLRDEARHAHYTGSERATHVLDNWSSLLPKFVKVFPHEYKRVLGVARTEAQKAVHVASAVTGGAPVEPVGATRK